MSTTEPAPVVIRPDRPGDARRIAEVVLRDGFGEAARVLQVDSDAFAALPGTAEGTVH